MSIYQNIVSFAVLVIAFSACKKAEKPIELKAETPVVKGVEVKSLRPEKPVRLPGELYSWNKVNIYSKVKGYVKEVKVDRGSKVKRGQILALLEAPELITELEKARGQVAASEALVNEALANYESSKIAYQRLLKASSTPGAVAAIELDQARIKMVADSANAATAKGNLEAAKSNLATQLEMANYLKIIAPFDGTIIERNISPGALIGAGEAGGVPMFVLEDNSKLRLTIAVPEQYTNTVSKSAEVTFTVNSVPDQRFTAVFGRSAESIVEKNRVMMTEFDVENSHNKLKAGMYAEVQLPLKRSTETLFVPVNSVVTSSEKVFVIKSVGNKAKWVPVKKGIQVDTLLEVFGDLYPGELVVKDASEEIREGEDLRIN
ncbi:MAG TPA: efflux RND transporter periplasmic adaptor subunit [Cytophagaceae bacterium]